MWMYDIPGRSRYVLYLHLRKAISHLRHLRLCSWTPKYAGYGCSATCTLTPLTSTGHEGSLELRSFPLSTTRTCLCYPLACSLPRAWKPPLCPDPFPVSMAMGAMSYHEKPQKDVDKWVGGPNIRVSQWQLHHWPCTKAAAISFILCTHSFFFGSSIICTLCYPHGISMEHRSTVNIQVFF